MAAGSGLFSTVMAKLEHLLRGGGMGREIRDLREDLSREFAPVAALAVMEWVNPPAASAVGLKAATATSTDAVTFTAADLLLSGVLAFARPLSFTTAGSAPEDSPESVTITGLDINGKLLTETVALSQTAGTDDGVKCFKSITKIEYPAAASADATISIGWGVGLGLPKAPKSRATAVVIALHEIVDAAAVIPPTATLSLPAANAPYGMYTPATAPNGAHDYCIYYDADMTLP